MDFKESVPFAGKAEEALATAQNTLSLHAFTVEESKSDSLHMLGHGSFLSSAMSPFAAVANIIITISEKDISLEADFGGINKTARMLMAVITVSMILLALAFGVAFMFLWGEKAVFVIYLVPLIFLPWLILIPMMLKIFKSKSAETLSEFLSHLAKTS